MEKIIKIDLQQYRTSGSKVFTGRDRGISVREASKIDIIEPNCEQIQIIVPSDIRSINPSFLEEFLINIVLKLGKDKFNQKIKFIQNGRYNVNNDLEEAIDRILREENALSY